MPSENEWPLTQRVENLPAYRFHPDVDTDSACNIARVPEVEGTMYALKLGGGNWCIVEFETVCVVASKKGVPGKRLPAFYVLRSPQLKGSGAQHGWDRVMEEVKSVEERWGGNFSTLIRKVSDTEDGIRVHGVSGFPARSTMIQC